MRGNKFLPFLIVSLTLTAFLAGYIMVSRGLNPSPQSKTGTILDKFGSPGPKPAGELSSAEESRIFPVSSVKATSISNSSDRKGVVYFEKNTGKVFEFNFEDNLEKVISDSVLPNFISSIWSPVKREVLSLFYSPSGTVIKYHNYDTAKTLALDTTIHSVAFSTDGSLVAYFVPGTASSSEPGQAGKIYISQPDGTYPKKILDTRITDLEVSWPIKDHISLETADHEIFLLTEAGKLTKLFDPSINLNTKWSVGGNKVLFSSGLGGDNRQLWLKDTNSKSETELGVVTEAAKCVWSIDNVTIFCAIAKTPSVDDIYQINTENGSQKLVAEPDMPIQDLFLPSLENYLVFTNKADGKLYGVKTGE